MLPKRKSRNFWIFYNLTSRVSSGSLSALGFEKPICPKLYYQCYPTEFRKDEHIALWTPEAELRYRRAVLDGSLSDLMNKLQTIEWFSEGDEDKGGILPNMKHMCSTISSHMIDFGQCVLTNAAHDKRGWRRLQQARMRKAPWKGICRWEV